VDRFNWDFAIQTPWLIFIVYWFVSGLRVNKMQQPEPKGERLLRILVMLAAFYLLSYSDPNLGVLNLRFVGFHVRLFELGAALTWAGVAFAIWARIHLGRYWSATVALREGHTLIRSGPYARIRHPIYTGMLLAVAGTALAVGRYRALVAFAIVLAGFIRKSKREEALLAKQFGSEFEEHRRRTGFFLPRLT